MPSFQWQSPLHPPCRRCDLEIENGVETKNRLLINNYSITAPFSGLYGLVFGVTQPNAPFEESHIFNYEEQDKTEKETSPKTAGRAKLCLTKHCGCTFQAIIKPDVNGNDNALVENSQIYASATMPLSSEPGNSDVSNSCGVTKVLTSTMIARIIYLTAQTIVRIECSTFCGEGKGVSSCIRNKGWEWGLILHMRTDIKGESDKHHMDTGMGSKKRIRDQYFSKAQQGVKNLNQNLSRCPAQKIDFNPPQVKKKPILCTVCGRKFSTALSVQHHIASAHLSSLSKTSNLVAPKIFCKPLIVLFENDEVVVVIKPQGMPVQGDKWTLGKSDLLEPFRASQTM